MYLLNLCESSSLLRLLLVLKLVFKIVLTIIPLLLIISITINVFKVVMDGKTDTLKNVLILSGKKLAAAFILFFLPSIFNFFFYNLIVVDFDYAACFNNATLEGIKEAEKNEEKTRLEQKDKEKQELDEAQKKKEEERQEQIANKKEEETNSGGSHDGEILSSGKQGEYFAPIQASSYSFSGRNNTGGCKNDSVYHDMGASVGTPVYAPYDGTAKYIQTTCNGKLASYGNQVRVYKDDGTFIIYAHFSKFPGGISMPVSADCKDNASHKVCGAGSCSSGTKSNTVATRQVKKGEIIGYTGNTGNSSGPHLHVEIHEKGSAYCVTDPWKAFGMR